ncbi:MAG TPA: GGDEF domain-containing protein [Gaiellaceae bacterium]|nr:GGDEF domain-containing protein [Gaiellaceae bacterium]
MPTAGVLYVGVFAAFLLIERPGLGIGHFYYLAIALVALGLGPGWGALAGFLAAALYSGGVLLNHALPVSDILTVSTPIRLVTYVSIGVLLGWFAQRYREANAELQLLAQRDVITGLPNTRAFELAIDRRLHGPQPFALLVGDLATIGFDEDHEQALRRVSDALLTAIGPEADVARIGGDEFAVLAPCDSVEEAAQLASRLERTLREHGSVVTFGWSASPREGANALTLYRAADERLYARRILREPRVSPVEALRV